MVFHFRRHDFPRVGLHFEMRAERGIFFQQREDAEEMIGGVVEQRRRWAMQRDVKMNAPFIRVADGRGEIGIIAPVTEPFCGHCNRLRLTADGKVRTCLFSLHEHDLKPLLRGSASDADLARRLREIVLGKEARHHIGEPDFVQPERTMSCIGG